MSALLYLPASSKLGSEGMKIAATANNNKTVKGAASLNLNFSHN
ncbi:MAG: hypothetical protein WKF59_13655 [Chitinophagaceae bacterium]